MIILPCNKIIAIVTIVIFLPFTPYNYYLPHNIHTKECLENPLFFQYASIAQKENKNKRDCLP